MLRPFLRKGVPCPGSDSLKALPAADGNLLDNISLDNIPNHYRRDPSILDGMGNPGDFRGSGPYAVPQELLDKPSFGQWHLEHVPSSAFEPGSLPKGLGDAYGNLLKGKHTGDLIEEQRELVRMLRQSDLPLQEQNRIIQEMWEYACSADASLHNGGGAFRMPPKWFDTLPSER